jgi:hypothetical protein
MPHKESKSRRIRDWLLYVGIAVVIVVSAILYGAHQGMTGGSAELPLKWIGFAGMTGIVFGYAIKACRPLWRRQKFWLVLGCFFVIHCGLGAFVLMRVPVVPLLLFGMLTGPEYMLLAVYLGFFMDSPERK